MIESASERIKNSITDMIFRDNYWGYLFSKINRAECLDLEAPMGVAPEIDGSITLLYNPSFIDRCRDDFLNAIIEHEGTHILNHHIPRLLRIISDEGNTNVKKEKQVRWNYAADCATNTIINIKKLYYLTDGSEFKVVHPDDYNLPHRKSAEYYYEHIPDDALPQIKKIYVNGGNVGDHKSWLKNISKVADIGSLAERLQQYTNSALEESYNNVRNKGNLPSFISQVISELLKPPQIPYYQLITKLVKGSRLSKQKRAFTRINKKRIYTFFIDQKNLPVISPFPGKTKDFSFNITVILDTSGSMNIDDIMEGLSGVKHIIEKDRYCLTTVIECDAQIQAEYQVKRLKDIQYQIRGRGGTVLFPALKRSRELNTDVTLVFTDGYTDNINSINRSLLPKKIIYVLTSDGRTEDVNETGYIVRTPERSKRKYNYSY
jgi:predicted metal-dependent peptidase